MKILLDKYILISTGWFSTGVAVTVDPLVAGILGGVVFIYTGVCWWKSRNKLSEEVSDIS